MELELGLALPNQTPMMVKGLDLNSTYNGALEMEKNKCYINYDNYQNLDLDHDHEHSFDEVESRPLSLLLWSGQPNEEDDQSPEKWRKLHQNQENIDEENQEMVGWPPISSLRKELLHRHQGGWMANHQAAAAAAAARNSMYVKVKMEGVLIGRKIDLRLHNSYQALTETLIHMFAKYTKNGSRGDGDYKILYQDKQGDWMLAGDVPWETFVESVRRMEILRNDN